MNKAGMANVFCGVIFISMTVSSSLSAGNDESFNITCGSKKMTWKNAVNFCIEINGILTNRNQTKKYLQSNYARQLFWINEYKEPKKMWTKFRNKPGDFERLNPEFCMTARYIEKDSTLKTDENGCGKVFLFLCKLGRARTTEVVKQQTTATSTRVTTSSKLHIVLSTTTRTTNELSSMSDDVNTSLTSTWDFSSRQQDIATDMTITTQRSGKDKTTDLRFERSEPQPVSTFSKTSIPLLTDDTSIGNTEKETRKDVTTSFIYYILYGAIGAVVLAVIIVCILRRKRPRRNIPKEDTELQHAKKTSECPERYAVVSLKDNNIEHTTSKSNVEKNSDVPLLGIKSTEEVKIELKNSKEQADLEDYDHLNSIQATKNESLLRSQTHRVDETIYNHLDEVTIRNVDNSEYDHVVINQHEDDPTYSTSMKQGTASNNDNYDHFIPIENKDNID